MRAASAIALLLLLAACGDSQGVESNAHVENLVRAGPVPTPSPPNSSTVEEGPAPQLEPMGSDEIEAAGVMGAGCDFSVGEQVLLVADADGEAVARVNGRIVRLFHQGDLGPTGGFFASRELRVSVGRIEGQEQRIAQGASWPARIAVTTRTAGQPSRVEGLWSCGS